jgi:flagellin
MSISILNDISSLVAENAVSNTQANLQNTLTQLSTGLKINSGADDPAGLSIADGLGANIAALTQSGQNVTNGIGLLQTADGALSQVTTILNQAVTIATEAANGGLTSDQANALETQFTAILNEINQIGNTTNFNGTSVFSGNTSEYLSTQGSVNDPLTADTDLTVGDSVTIHDNTTGGTLVFTAQTGTNEIGDLQEAIDAGVEFGTLSAGTEAVINNGQLEIENTNGNSLQVSTNDPTLGGFSPVASGSSTANVFTSDGTSSGSFNLQTSIASLSASTLGLSTQSLSTTADAQTALTAITAAIAQVAAARGSIGANINTLTSDSNVENTEVQNLTSAQNNVQNADIAKVTTNLTQYNVLEQTGFAALQQSQQAQQNVLKLLQ